MKTNLFLDVKFTSFTQFASPICLSILSEGDRYFYAEFSDYNKDGES